MITVELDDSMLGARVHLRSESIGGGPTRVVRTVSYSVWVEGDPPVARVTNKDSPTYYCVMEDGRNDAVWIFREDFDVLVDQQGADKSRLAKLDAEILRLKNEYNRLARKLEQTEM